MRSTVDEKWLRGRWTADLSNAAISYLLGKGPAPFADLIETRVDLRGLSVTVPLKGVKIHSADVSFAVVDRFGQFVWAELQDTLFVGARIQNRVEFRIDKCGFQYANLDGAVLRGFFNDSDFSGTLARKIIANEVEFQRCRFQNCNFRGAHLVRCRFLECVFNECNFANGSLAYSRFENCTFANNILGNALLEKTVGLSNTAHAK